MGTTSRQARGGWLAGRGQQLNSPLLRTRCRQRALVAAAREAMRETDNDRLPMPGTVMLQGPGVAVVL